MLRFVHAADIHLDSPLCGLSRYEGAPFEAIRGATRRALENLVQLCISEEVDFLLIAGDLYDGDWRDYNTGLFFVKQMGLLTRAGIRVVLVRGNHDAASQLTRNLSLPPGVFELSTRKADTCVFEDLGVAVHGHGYPQRAVSEDLSARYPPPLAGFFNIGLLHTALDGRVGHDLYAPCRVQDLIDKGYDYWALGHVHQREVLCQGPWIVFPGNLQGRHAREPGSKGATLVCVEDAAVTAIDHRSLDVVRWALCRVDCSEATSGFDVVDLIQMGLAAQAQAAGDRLLAVRLELQGSSQAHRVLNAEPERWSNEIRAGASALDSEVWVEKIQLRTQKPWDVSAVLEHDHPLAGVLTSLRGLGDEGEELEVLSRAFAELQRKLPYEYWQLEDALKLDNPDTLKALLGQVEQLLLTRLLDAWEGG